MSKKPNFLLLVIIGNRLANLNHQFDVKINEHYLERAKTYKYLGIDLDESLSWDSHIDNVVKKRLSASGLSNASGT